MSKGMVFWIVMLIWLIIGVFYHYNNRDNKYFAGFHVLIWCLLFLVGWALFGFPIQ
jgi:hypothetical protein